LSSTSKFEAEAEAEVLIWFLMDLLVNILLSKIFTRRFLMDLLVNILLSKIFTRRSIKNQMRGGNISCNNRL
jgi:hypothetical protein